MATHSTFSLFTSVRYDPKLEFSSPNTELCGHASPFYMLPYHQQRMLAAAEHFSWTEAISALSSLDDFERWLMDAVKVYNAASNPENQPLKVRVSLGPSSTMLEAGFSPVPPVVQETLFPTSLAVLDRPVEWKARIYQHPLTPDEYSTFKTTHRTTYDEARKAFGLDGQPTPSKVEVLLQDGAGNILEGTLTSVYFNVGDRWVTPAAGREVTRGKNRWKGGQDGTSRRWALTQSLCVAGAVNKFQISNGDVCMISSGVRGFFPCRVEFGAEV